MKAHNLRRVVLYLWASPATTVGLLFAGLALMGGGSARVIRGIIEVHGGIVTWILARGFPWAGSGVVVTFGHVILGPSPMCLARCRSHEHVHVRQYEKWGPLFLPAYFLASLLAHLRGQHPYLDNPFEQEAYQQTEVEL